MANIFKNNQNVNEHPKRNNFDLSFQNHLTMKFGTLYPVFCKEVVPGDSFRIESAFGLKFMPLVFPVQSGMRATMHFFYCRNKNLWKNWENWVSNLEEHTHPYISKAASFFKTGSLADYLDIPTTLISSREHLVSLDTSHSTLQGIQSPTAEDNSAIGSFIPSQYAAFLYAPTQPDVLLPMNWELFVHSFDVDANYHGNVKAFAVNSPLPAPFSLDSNNDIRIVVNGVLPSTADSIVLTFWHTNGDDISSATLVENDNGVPTGIGVRRVNQGWSENELILQFRESSHYISRANQYIANGEKVFLSLSIPYSEDDPDNFLNTFVMGQTGFGKGTLYISGNVSYYGVVTQPVDISETTSIPYGTQSDQIHLNALPFRAYESIYQAFYRNTRNQEFLVNGEPVYNRYNTTLEDGADETDYHLYQRNYELDYLTSALRSPQQGNAPLVGMSALGTITIEDEDGITTAQAQLADDGQTITGVNVTSPIAGRAHALTLAEIASAGFSINDFRQTNALVHWLETNLRKGYRYIDFISGHFGKSPKYNELDMPEFIGGYSRDVQVNSILNQTASPDADPLGSFAGTANCFGGSKHSISHYCDDYGWIIGILCVTPQPAYSQLLPKHYLKQSPLDYFFPEFAQIGMQPVTYEEVCPVQAWSEYQSDHSKKLQDTFGYQRPNYDMVAYTDQVHGNFRTDLRNFLINRIFANRPELGDDFLQINPDEVNDIFQVTTPNNDVIAGQIVFRVFAKRPIPRIHMPALGR